MIRKSLRRHKARRTPALLKNPKMKFKEIVENCLEPQPYYNEWLSFRDGFFNFPAKEKKDRELKKGLHKRRQKRIKFPSTSPEQLPHPQD